MLKCFPNLKKETFIKNKTSTISLWNSNFFDWCWTCFDMGQRLGISDDWAEKDPETCEISKSIIRSLQKQNQNAIEYFSFIEDEFLMKIPLSIQSIDLNILLPGFLFLIKEHIGMAIYLSKWTYDNNNIYIYFKEQLP